MMEYAIEVTNLVKKYKTFTALNHLNLHVPAGKVYGFLGKNGSGKTTTIRIIMGLIKADQGNVKIFDSDMQQNRKQAIQKIGAVVETPGAYENLSAKENLGIAASMRHLDPSRIEEVLSLVGLSHVQDKRVGNFSLGMKQRLGIAHSLLHSPQIIILDEPTNGLDPEGIHEIRNLIRDLSENHGISILISSHLLSEIEQMADYVGIIQDGHLLQESKVSSLNMNEQKFVLLEADQPQKVQKILATMQFPYEFDQNAFRIFCSKEQNSLLNYQLITNGISVNNLSSTSKTLEERFLSITEAANNKEIALI